ncbi:MAG: hypothetical protein HY078_00490 [Elusimicrobia bacterium]|nr:hypothetical protein [Elusimicrobiota bacterium]
MRRSYLGQWLFILLATGSCILWKMEGQAYVRREYYGVWSPKEADRTERKFLALLFPRITRRGAPHTISLGQFEAIVTELNRNGYTAIRLRDVKDFYEKKRLLPRRAVLLTFDEDYPKSVRYSDKVLKRLRMPGTLFLNGIATSGRVDQRQFLSRHALGQLVKGGAWDFGAVSQPHPVAAPDLLPALDAVLENDQRLPSPLDPEAHRFKFVESEIGYNDDKDQPRSLKVMTVSPSRTAAETLRIIDKSWPREVGFADDFSKPIAENWIVGWGIVSAEPNRLALLPTPKQTGAGILLRGTERWRDVAIEFEVKRYEKELWAYARYREDGGFVRAGLRNGFWYIEQKIGPKHLVTMLARAPVTSDSMPSRVRFVVKEDAALLHVNGRMLFGRSLRVHPNVDYGRILLAVYDARPRSAMGLVTSFRADPLGASWVALSEAGGPLDERRLKGLREEAVYARAISPQWLKIGQDGGLAQALGEREFLASLAGFFRCRLIPLVSLPDAGTFTLGDPRTTDRLVARLGQAAEGQDIAGLNLQLRTVDMNRPQTIRFLKQAHAELRRRKRELWITSAGPLAPSSAMAGAVDGVLLQSRRNADGLTLLEAARGGHIQ